MHSVREQNVEIDQILHLHALGLAENSAGRPAAAATKLRRALRMLAQSPPIEAADPADVGAQRAFMRARLLLTLAKSEAELRGVEKGLARLAEADAVAGQFDDAQIRVAIHNQRGLMLLRVGRDEDALAEFDRAETWFGSAPPLEQCNVLLNRGAQRLDRVELALARADLQRCKDLAARHGLVLLAAMATHNLGYLEFLAGNLPLALSSIDDGSEIAQGMPKAAVLLDRARILSEAGLTREADRTLGEARDLSRGDRLYQELAEIEFQLATSAFQSGELELARRHAAAARDRFRRRHNDRWRRRAELLLLQIDLRRGRAPLRVAGLAAELSAGFSAKNQPVSARLAAFIAAEALLDAGCDERAFATAVSAGPAGLADPIAARIHTRYLRARLELRRGNRSLASGEVRRGLDDLADYQAHFGSVDLRTASAIHGLRLAELGLSIAMDTGRPAAVFAAIERGRANSSRMPVVRPSPDEQTAAMLTELRRTVEAQRAAGPAAPALQSLQRRRSSLERRISARGWSLPGARTSPAPVDIDAVQGALQAWDSTMVSFFTVGETMQALVLGPNAAAVHPVGDYREIFTLIQRVRADFDLLAYSHLASGVRASAAASVRRGLERLDERLLRPLGLEQRRVVLTPTASLAAIPWGGLPSRYGVPTTVASSATAWMRALPALNDRFAAPNVTALAGPDLRRSAAEARDVAHLWPGATAVVGAVASRQHFTAAFVRSDLLHLAAHGQHETQNPLFSSLRLADGLLFAYELDALQSAPAHVVLSACDLGLSTVRPGDETLGLTSVLLALGTRSIVSGVARVADEVAHEVMVDYHRRLSNGADSALALAGATAAASTSGVPAPFVCFGSHWSAAPEVAIPTPSGSAEVADPVVVPRVSAV